MKEGPRRRLERGGGAAEVDRSRFTLPPLPLVIISNLVLMSLLSSFFSEDLVSGGSEPSRAK